MSYKNFPLLVGGRGFGKVAAMKARIAELERDNAALHKALAESELKVKEPTLFQELYLTSPAVHYAIKSEIRKLKYGEELPVEVSRRYEALLEMQGNGTSKSTE